MLNVINTNIRVVCPSNLIVYSTNSMFGNKPIFWWIIALGRGVKLSDDDKITKLRYGYNFT